MVGGTPQPTGPGGTGRLKKFTAEADNESTAKATAAGKAKL